MRLFIAIPLGDAMRDAVRDVQDEFRRSGVRGNYTRVENLHLTLAFIGEYADADYVLETMASVQPRPFELRLRGIGAFGDLWWIGLDQSAALVGCARGLRRALADAGIPFDRKRFSPHITLMRSDRGKSGMIYTEIR